MKRAYADVPEGQIHYRIEGDGEPLILVHMVGCSSRQYIRMLPFLSKTYRAIALDLPGSGQSYKPSCEYQIRDYARSVVNFMDSLEIDKASLVGHHAGAKVVVEVAAIWPDRVNKLVLSSLPYFQNEEERIPFSKDPAFKQLEADPDGWHLIEWWRRAKRYGDPVEVVAERVLDFHMGGAKGEFHWAASAYSPRLKTTLPLIKCPTLVLSGTLDRFYSVVEDIKRLIPRSKMTIIENAGVYVDRVMPKESAEAILSFLENSGV